MPIAKIKMIVPNGSWENKKFGGTMYSFIYNFPNPDGIDDVRVEANHKKEGGIFNVGDEVEYTITELKSGGYPHNGKVSKPQQGSFSPAPSSAASSQPSSNGEPSLSFEETKAKAIHDSVIFKGAVRMWIAQPNDSLGKIAVRARALMSLCSCVEIPKDNEPVLSEEPPF